MALRKDPAGCYAEMDFESRDLYRQQTRCHRGTVGFDRDRKWRMRCLLSRARPMTEDIAIRGLPKENRTLATISSGKEGKFFRHELGCKPNLLQSAAQLAAPLSR